MSPDNPVPVDPTPVDPELLLADPTAIASADPAGMLRAIASAGAQVRSAVRAYDEARAALDPVVADGRPRTIVVAGMGGSGVSGDVLAAVVGPGCPVQVVSVRDYVLPGWVGALDLVLAVSCSGGTEETLALVDEAVRRGCRVVGFGAPGSPLAARIDAAGAPYVPSDNAGRQPRASMWALAVPLLLLAHDLGLADVPRDVLAATADRLDALAERYAPGSSIEANAAKGLALELLGTTPIIWGTGTVGAAASYRFACQVNENAKLPASYGVLPEANHNQVVAFDGPLAGGGQGGRGDQGDVFFDPHEDGPRVAALRLVLVRDTDEHPQVRRRVEVSVDLADDRGVRVSQLRTDGTHAVERLADLVALGDFASAYLAVAVGVDPTPVGVISALKTGIAR
jgi:glucose/mannose-6-phosphate isomerase